MGSDFSKREMRNREQIVSTLWTSLRRLEVESQIHNSCGNEAQTKEFDPIIERAKQCIADLANQLGEIDREELDRRWFVLDSELGSATLTLQGMSIAAPKFRKTQPASAPPLIIDHELENNPDLEQWKDDREPELARMAFDDKMASGKLATTTSLLRPRDWMRYMRQAAPERAKLLEWLDVPNTAASGKQSAFEKMKHEGTGEWFLCKDALQAWLSTPGSFLWVHGGPGCGKSVLLSTAVRYLLSRPDPKPGCAFYYFNLEDVSSQKPDTLNGDAMVVQMLRALLHQILLNYSDRVKSFARLDLLYLYFEENQVPPSAGDLLGCLHDVARKFSGDLYILLDALDVCHLYRDRELLMKIIQTIQKWDDTPRLHVLVTSHDVPDIRRDLDLRAEQIVTMKNPGVHGDIAKYIDHEATTDQTLSEWKAKYPEAYTSLIGSAQGMFRYVACQLQELRTALHKREYDAVPPGLSSGMHGTYEELLSRIGSMNRKHVRRFLTLLSCSDHPLTELEVVHSLAVDLQEPSHLDLEGRLCQGDGFRRMCGSLIEVEQPSGLVSLCHPSLRQYLESDAIRGQELEVATFAIDRESANREIAQVCLVYLTSALSDESSGQQKIEKFPFARFAATKWFHYYAACPDKGTGLQDLALQLFDDSTGGCFSAWVDIYDTDIAVGSSLNPEKARNDRRSPIYYARLLGLDDIVRRVLEREPNAMLGDDRHVNAL